MSLRHFDEALRQWPAPDFTLADRRGRKISRHHFRERCNLVLLFLPDSITATHRQVLTQLAVCQPQFRAQEAEILIVHTGPLQADAHLILLADPGGETARNYAAFLDLEPASPFLILLDRYGAPYAALTGAEAVSSQTAAAVLAQLITLQLECPE